MPSSLIHVIVLHAAFIAHLVLSKETILSPAQATSTHFLPRDFPLPSDLEVWKTEQNYDEDIFYLRARASQDDCTTDCPTWPIYDLPEDVLDEIVDLEANEEEEKEDLQRRKSATEWLQNLVERASSRKKLTANRAKKAFMCKEWTGKGDNRVAVPDTEIRTKSLPYPSLQQAAEKDHQLEVWDFEDPKDPNKKSFWKLRDIEKIHTIKDHNGKEREYGVEHILEWHLLKDFIEEDHIPIIAPKPTPSPSPSSAPPGSTPSAGTPRPKYTRTQKVNRKLRGLSWVALQFPGSKNSRNPFYKEFTVLQKNINGRKLLLWKHDTSIVKNPIRLDKGTGAISEKDQSNTNTMDMMIQNMYIEEKKTFKWEENEGKLAALGVFRDVLGVYKYYQQDHIQKILVTQVKRIADAFEYLETEVLPKHHNFFKDKKTNEKIKFQDDKGNEVKYKSHNLKDQWNTFMKERFAESKTKIEEWLKKWNDEFEKVYNEKRSLEERAKPESLPSYCGREKDNDVLKKRIKLLLDAYKDRGDWKNPFD